MPMSKLVRVSHTLSISPLPPSNQTLISFFFSDAGKDAFKERKCCTTKVNYKDVRSRVVDRPLVTGRVL